MKEVERGCFDKFSNSCSNDMQEVRAGSTIRLNVPKLADLQLNMTVMSPSSSIANLPWALKVSKEIKCLAVYANCNSLNRSSDWSCEAKVTFRLLPQKDGKLPYIKEFECTFDHQIPGCGYASFMKWDDVLYPETGYIREDGGIVVEATITIKKVFIKQTPCDFSTPQPSFREFALVIGEQRLYVNKEYLAMISPVFKAMFFGPYDEKDKREIPLQDVDRDEFVELLNVIEPSRKQPVTVDRVESLLRLGDRYDIQFVLRECEQLLCGDCGIALEKKLLWADRYRLAGLQFVCLNAITTVDEAKKLKSTAEFGDFSMQMKEALLEQILMHD